MYTAVFQPFRRGTAAMLAVLVTVVALLPLFCVGAQADNADRRVPYAFSIDTVYDKQNAYGEERPYIDKNRAMRPGQQLVFTGWLAVDEGVSRYEYAFVAQDDLVPAWKPCEHVTISARPDLTKAGIAHTTGHGTAGFNLTVTAPTDVDGMFDFYLRGVSGDDVYCDILIIVNVTVGMPDTDDGRTHTVNMSRLAREAASAMTDGTFENGKAVLSAKSVLSLGTFDLGLFDSISIEYETDGTFRERKSEDRTILGIKTAPAGSRAGQNPDPYAMDDGRYNLTDSLACGTLTKTAEGKTSMLTFDLTELQGVKPLYLSAYTFDADTVRIVSVTLTYLGNGTDRVAAKIYFSADLASYFYSPHCCEIATVHDPVMGDVMRVSAPEETNDAYIHFNAEGLLDTKGVKISATDYKYMVVLCRANKTNRGNHMTFYLCPGGIGGPTEACTKSCSLEPDGKWHYVILDLNTPDTWQGTLHLWRFDMINGMSNAGDYVDYASVQFFRTSEAAEKAASASLTNPADPYTCGGDPVFLDMSEEEALAARDIPFTPAADRVYIFEEPATEPATEPTTEPATEPTAESAAEAVSGTEPVSTEAGTEPAESGCTGTVCTVLPLAMTAVGISCAKRGRRRKP